ncbi:MAG: MFS transporter [Kiritimatiellia bacterium]
MILEQELTLEQRKRSQRNINAFNAVNGLSYMCVGETLMILLALKLGFSDVVTAVLGGMMFFGFVLLPLGKVVSARVGGARSQAVFWVARNFAALVVASSALWKHFGLSALALICLVGGAFFFYGFRAAGVVMSQPLLGDISTDEERPRFIATNSALFYAACFVALIAISVVLKISETLLAIALIIVAGSALGVFASTFLRRVDETGAIRDSARRPVVHEMVEALRDSSFRRLLLGSFVNNLSLVMLAPVSVLFIKRGHGVSDTGALLFSLLQYGSAALASIAVAKITPRIGPRKTLILAYSLMLVTAVLWSFAPDVFTAAMSLAALLFALAGATRVTSENSVTHYFLQTVSAERRVSATMLMNMVTGVGAGAIGMLLSGGLLHCLGRGVDPSATGAVMIPVYRRYFALAFALLLPGLFCLLRMVPLPMEKRRQKRSGWQAP